MKYSARYHASKTRGRYEIKRPPASDHRSHRSAGDLDRSAVQVSETSSATSEWELRWFNLGVDQCEYGSPASELNSSLCSGRLRQKQGSITAGKQRGAIRYHRVAVRVS